MLTTVLRAPLSSSPPTSSSSGMIFQPFLLPRHFLIRNDISCLTTETGSGRSGLGFLRKTHDERHKSRNLLICKDLEQAGEAVLEQAGELVLDRDCFSLAALKLACRRSSLLKLLARCSAGLSPRLTSSGESGGSGERGALGGSSSGCSAICLQ